MADQRQKLINQMIGSFWEMHTTMRGHRGWGHARQNPLSRQQIELLFVILQYDSPSVKEIADSLGITSGAVSQLIEHLVEHGLLERNSTDVDRRVVRVRFTKRGRHSFKHIQAHRIEKMTEFLSALDDAELEQFVELFDKMMRGYAAKHGGDYVAAD